MEIWCCYFLTSRSRKRVISCMQRPFCAQGKIPPPPTPETCTESGKSRFHTVDRVAKGKIIAPAGKPIPVFWMSGSQTSYYVNSAC